MILTPEYIFRRVEAIRPEFLAQKGIRALVLDVDNTLTADGSQVLEDSVRAWLAEMRGGGHQPDHRIQQHGKRVQPFAERIGLAWVSMACKPLPLGLMVARRRLGVKKYQMPWWGTRSSRPDGGGAVWHSLPVPAAPHAHDKARSVQIKRKFEPRWLAAILKREANSMSDTPRFGRRACRTAIPARSSTRRGWRPTRRDSG